MNQVNVYLGGELLVRTEDDGDEKPMASVPGSETFLRDQVYNCFT
jgi:hypothetical protein